MVVGKVIKEDTTVSGRQIKLIENDDTYSIIEGKDILCYGTYAKAAHKWECLVGTPIHFIKED